MLGYYWATEFVFRKHYRYERGSFTAFLSKTGLVLPKPSESKRFRGLLSTNNWDGIDYAPDLTFMMDVTWADEVHC